MIAPWACSSNADAGYYAHPRVQRHAPSVEASHGGLGYREARISLEQTKTQWPRNDICIVVRRRVSRTFARLCASIKPRAGTAFGNDERRQITLRCRMSLTSAAEQPSHSP